MITHIRKAHVAASAAAFAALLVFGLLLSSCTDAQQSRENSAYAPVFARAKSNIPASARGTLKGDFQWAASSATLAEAEAHWSEFLRTHRPPDGEYEDSFAVLHVQSAELELLRIEYLLGKRAEGDARLRRIDPLRIGSEAELQTE